MIPIYLREQKRYTQKELADIFGYRDEKEIIPMLRKLKEYGILKTVRASSEQKDLSELSEEDVVVTGIVAGDTEYFHVSTFVGVIVAEGFVLKCYPKYLPEDEGRARKEMRLVIKVLEKYSNSKEQLIRMFNETRDGAPFNLLSVLLYFLWDYYENGIYSNTEKIIETNGRGEIIWDRTINNTIALLQGNRPYYAELQTRKRSRNEQDYFKRLHECILTKASKELEDAELLELFDLTGVALTDEEQDEFGDADYIIYRIDRELGTQFNTRKQLLLRAMRAYVGRKGTLYETGGMSLFGTNSFNLVWEKVCAAIMDNKLEISPLGALKLPRPLRAEYENEKDLKSLIEKPLWTKTEKRASGTLIPDLITIAEIRGKLQFIIFDAKYYTPVLEKGREPQGQPGIESVTKQYLYQAAYQRFIKKHRFSAVKNCFLLPTWKESGDEGGEVSMLMMRKMGRQKLQNIKVRFLPAVEAFEHYISGKKYSIEKLNL